MVKKNYRQGDVFLKRVEELPEKLIEKDGVLAYGEVTGHEHRVTGQAAVLLSGSQQFVDVQGDSTLVHEEHAPLSLRKGKYKVVLQRELNLLGEVRQVMD